ncbi:MAG: hypothetical protein KBG15_21070, partial [Kofleriaceae bacterium]|nr:hypothetical protein [Kofleriaceae bacterium]
MALAPLGPPRSIAIHRDGELAVIVGRDRALVLSLADLTVVAALLLDPAAVEADAVWLAERLLVAETYATHTRVQLFDVAGPTARTCCETQIASAFRARGGGGTAALMLANNQAAVCTRHDDSLLMHPFASRVVPISVGAGSGVVVVGTAGAVEEWDLQSRTVRRRWKLAPSALPLAVGATERVIWFLAKHDPTRIEVIPLVNRGQPKVQAFGTAVVQVCGAAKTDWVVGLGTEGGLHAVDLEGRVAPVQLPAIDGLTATVIGLAVARTTQLLAMDENGIAVVGLDANNRLIAQKQWRDIDAHAPVFRPAYQAPAGVTLAVSGPEAAARSQAAAPQLAFGAASLHAAIAAVPQPVVTAVAAAMGALAPVARPDSLTQQVVTRDHWRDSVSGFAKNPDVAVFARAGNVPPRILTLLQRLELDAALSTAVMLLYGSYLNGAAGVARVDLARLLDGDWLEATGNGELQRRGLADFSGHLVTLPAAVQRFLDERAPQAGCLSRGTSGTSGATVTADSPAVILVAPLVASDAMALAQHCVDTVGGSW